MFLKLGLPLYLPLEFWRVCRFIQIKNNNVRRFWRWARFMGDETVGYRPAANKATVSGDSGYISQNATKHYRNHEF